MLLLKISKVPQGSILGPILFLIYINNLPDVCPNVNIQMYADDVVVFTHTKSQQEASQILMCDDPNPKLGQGLMFTAQHKENCLQ